MYEVFDRTKALPQLAFRGSEYCRRRDTNQGQFGRTGLSGERRRKYLLHPDLNPASFSPSPGELVRRPGHLPYQVLLASVNEVKERSLAH